MDIDEALSNHEARSCPIAASCLPECLNDQQQVSLGPTASMIYTLWPETQLRQEVSNSWRRDLLSLHKLQESMQPVWPVATAYTTNHRASHSTQYPS